MTRAGGAKLSFFSLSLSFLCPSCAFPALISYITATTTATTTSLLQHYDYYYDCYNSIRFQVFFFF
ncbi:hypothetical protein TWF730_000310 [Orbilia blumenaviensis]|uniref:Secreted protein n=1 Tax=Orbilia blumenaviensis TaxID=1796055 RepID=A0AAV9VN77_9PEZI